MLSWLAESDLFPNGAQLCQRRLGNAARRSADVGPSAAIGDLGMCHVHARRQTMRLQHVFDLFLGIGAGGAVPDIDHCGALWFAAVGLCNGLSVLAMYGALEYGPVAIISPLAAGMQAANVGKRRSVDHFAPPGFARISLTIVRLYLRLMTDIPPQEVT
jgi:hypothetical protein